MVFKKIVFRVHAIQRMYQRSITAEDVHTVIQTGETIEDYPNDVPYPSRLILGWCGLRPIHVVVADNAFVQIFVTFLAAVGLWLPILLASLAIDARLRRPRRRDERRIEPIHIEGDVYVLAEMTEHLIHPFVASVNVVGKEEMDVVAIA